MKKTNLIFVTLLVFAMTLALAGCGKKENSIVGTWECNDTENDISTVYDLKDDGTGTYTMNVAGEEVIYELKYEIKDNHLLVRYVNNDTFSEDDEFDNEFQFKDDNTLIIKDSFDEEMTYVRK